MERRIINMNHWFGERRGMVLCLVLAAVPFFAFSQDISLSSAGTIPSLEDISRQVGTPITTIMWRTERGNMRFRRAVKRGVYERRFRVEGRKVVYEDRGELDGDWQEWYQTGENELDEGKRLEETLRTEWDWNYGITLYQENVDKTMVIKFIQREDGGFYTDGEYLYLYGEWYFIEGKL
jgi:hypothetical protein